MINDKGCYYNFYCKMRFSDYNFSERKFDK